MLFQLLYVKHILNSKSVNKLINLNYFLFVLLNGFCCLFSIFLKTSYSLNSRKKCLYFSHSLKSCCSRTTKV